jgi:hypothetical protein
MSSDLTWKRDANGVEHPARETLLAFIREQCSEHEENRINEHLLAGCVPCNRLHAILTQDSNALNQLKHMSRYLYYPELQSNQVLFHIQRGEPLTSIWTGKRKGKFQVQSRLAGRSASQQFTHKTGLRIFRVSFPVAFGLLLIVTTVAIVLAYTIASFVKLPFQLPGQQPNILYYSPGPDPTNIAEHQPTPTATVPVTITPTPTVSATVDVSPTPTVTVTVTAVPGPAIDYCPLSGYKGPLIYICGYRFKAGDKVSLLLEYYGSNTPVMWRDSYRVNAHGEFSGYLYFSSCKYVPRAIYAKDETLVSASVTSNMLTNIPVAGCYGLTPTPTPGGRS